MKLLAYLLLFTAVLAAPACSKNNDTAAPAATGSYTLDGRKVVATSAASQHTAGSAGSDDLLYIQLLSQGSGGSETLEAIYTKRVGTPESAFQPLNLRYTTATGTTSYYSLSLALTLTKTEAGYSGTFAGTFPGVGRSQISEGVFANVP